jgi:hypothetical protein
LTSGVLGANLQPIQEKALGKWSEPPRRCPGLSFCTSPSVRLRSDPLFRQHRRREHGNYGGANPMMQTRRQSRRRMMTGRARQQQYSYGGGGLLPTAIPSASVIHCAFLTLFRLVCASTKLQGQTVLGNGSKGLIRARKDGGLGLGWAGLAGAAGLHLPSHPLTSSVKSRLTRRRADASARVTWIWEHRPTRLTTARIPGKAAFSFFCPTRSSRDPVSGVR